MEDNNSSKDRLVGRIYEAIFPGIEKRTRALVYEGLFEYLLQDIDSNKEIDRALSVAYNPDSLSAKKCKEPTTLPEPVECLVSKLEEGGFIKPNSGETTTYTPTEEFSEALAGAGIYITQKYGTELGKFIVQLISMGANTEQKQELREIDDFKSYQRTDIKNWLNGIKDYSIIPSWEKNEALNVLINTKLGKAEEELEKLIGNFVSPIYELISATGMQITKEEEELILEKFCAVHSPSNLEEEKLEIKPGKIFDQKLEPLVNASQYFELIAIGSVENDMDLSKTALGLLLRLMDSEDNYLIETLKRYRKSGLIETSFLKTGAACLAEAVHNVEISDIDKESDVEINEFKKESKELCCMDINPVVKLTLGQMLEYKGNEIASKYKSKLGRINKYYEAVLKVGK